MQTKYFKNRVNCVPTLKDWQIKMYYVENVTKNVVCKNVENLQSQVAQLDDNIRGSINRADQYLCLFCYFATFHRVSLSLSLSSLFAFTLCSLLRRRRRRSRRRRRRR